MSDLMENENEYGEEHDRVSDIISQLPPDEEDEAPYTQEDMVDRFLVRNTNYRTELKKIIKNAPFKQQTKATLVVFIDNYLNSTVFMANLTPRKTSLMEHRADPITVARNGITIEFLRMQGGIARTDKNKPLLHTILGNLTKHIEFVLSRTEGPDREGIINRKSMRESAQTVTTKEVINQKTPQRKKSMWG